MDRFVGGHDHRGHRGHARWLDIDAEAMTALPGGVCVIRRSDGWVLCWGHGLEENFIFAP